MERRFIIAYSEPPERFGFRLTKSGKAYYRIVDAKLADNLVAGLVALGIHGRNRRCETPEPGRKPKRPQGSRGAPARSNQQDNRDRWQGKQALDIYNAGIIEGRKRRRNRQETDKLAAELARQNQKRQETEALKRAEEVARTFN